jgi:DNA repair protein RecN (Recombination protein N)
MLNHLSITNYAIIESLELDLNNGFTVITGETGAGKSILLGALSLILGQRAETSVLNDKEKKCIVEGTFELKEADYFSFFEDNDLDFDSQTIIRREINVNGKSRAFINDTPVGLAVVKKLASTLLDIHSQHETLNLKDNQFQIKVIDAYAGLEEEVADYRTQFNQYLTNKRKLKELVESSSKATSDFDYLSFQANEIAELNLKVNEKEQIEEELSQINNSEEIKNALTSGLEIISESESNVTQQLKSLANLFYGISEYSDEYKAIYERLNSVVIELDDLTSELNNVNDNFSFDPQNLAFLTDRIGKIYAIEQKHNLNSTEEIQELLNKLQDQLNGFNSLEEKILEQEDLVLKQKQKVISLAKGISNKRSAVLHKFENETIANLGHLGMEKAAFEVGIALLDEPNEKGIDRLEFLFSANQGFEVKPIDKVASGGELSRLMLIVKMFLTRGKKLSTIIFDEIDTGVSGDIADKMAEIMAQIAENTQVIAITHLPQVAAKGTEHFRISKESKNSKTITMVDKIDGENRVKELAKMLSGKNLTPEALKNAEVLLISN